MKLLHGFSSPTFAHYGPLARNTCRRSRFRPRASPSTFSHTTTYLPVTSCGVGPLVQSISPCCSDSQSHITKSKQATWLRDPKDSKRWHDGLVAPICRCTGVTFQVGS